MSNFLDLDFPYPPLFSDKDFDCVFSSKLFVLPLSEVHLCDKIYDNLKAAFNSDIETVIFIVPTFNYLQKGFISFLPQMLHEIAADYNIDFELLRNIQEKFSLKFEDFNFEFSEYLKSYFDYFKKINPNIKFLPLFFYDFDAGVVYNFLEKYYGDYIIILLSNLSKNLQRIDAEDNNEKTAFLIEDNVYEGLNCELFSAYNFLSGLIKFNLDNKFSLIRLFLTSPTDAGMTVHSGIWALFEGSKAEFIKKYHSKTVIDFIMFHLRRDLHLICGEEFITPEVFNEKFKVSVTIENAGCIRGVSPIDENYDILSKGLIRQAYGAAFSDDRFAPLKPDEFSCLNITVTLYTNDFNNNATIKNS